MLLSVFAQGMFVSIRSFFYSVNDVSWLDDPVLYMTCDVMHFSMSWTPCNDVLDCSRVLGTDNEAVGWDQERGGKRGDKPHTVVGRLILCNAYKIIKHVSIT